MLIWPYFEGGSGLFCTNPGYPTHTEIFAYSELKQFFYVGKGYSTFNDLFHYPTVSVSTFSCITDPLDYVQHLISQTYNVDRPAKHSLPLSKLTNLSSGNWDDFVDRNFFLQSMHYF